MRVRTLVASKHETFQRSVARLVQVVDPCIEVVGGANTAGEVLAAVDALQPDLVLLDLSLWPGKTLYFVTHVRQQAPATAVIVIENQPAAEYREAAIAAGALDCVDVLELSTTLPAALDRVPQVVACHERLRQATEWAPREETPKVVPPRPARRWLPARLLELLRMAPIGPRHGPYTAWQYVHLVLAFALAEVTVTLWHAPAIHVEQSLPALLVLAAIAVLEARQFTRARHAARAAEAR